MHVARNFFHNTFSSLKVRNYRLYFIGQAISLSGTWMGTVALGWLVVELTGSGTQLGLVIGLQFVPMLFLGPWGGVIVDRFYPRRIFKWTQIAFALLSFFMSVLIFTGLVEVWMVYVFALCFGMIRVFDDSARQAFVFDMVGGENLKNAVSLNGTENNLARAIGPTIAGALIVGFGIGFCFLANALSYLAVLAVLRMMRAREFRAAEPSLKRPGQLLEGLRYAWSTPLIRNTLLLMAIIGAFTFEFQVTLPLFSDKIFNAGAPGYAALYTAMGLGSVLGGLYAAGRKRVAPHQLVIFMLCFGLSSLATSGMPTLHLAALGMFAVGFFSINVTSVGNTMIQLETAPAMRGRVMSLWNVAMLGTTPIGAPLVGFIGQSFGARWGIAFGGLAAIVAAGLGIVSLLKKDTTQTIPGSVHIGEEEMLIGNTKL